jgi:hypothetical protein
MGSRESHSSQSYQEIPVKNDVALVKSNMDSVKERMVAVQIGLGRPRRHKILLESDFI